MHTKGTRHLGERLCGARAEGILPQPETGLPALLCCSSLFTHHGRVRAQEEILTRRLRPRTLQREGPGHMWDWVTGGNSVTGADANPRSRTKKTTSAQLLLLESYFGTEVTVEKCSETLEQASQKCKVFFFQAIFRRLLKSKMFHPCHIHCIFHTCIHNTVR